MAQSDARSYDDLDLALGRNEHVKLANNTYAHRVGRTITVSLHQTTILRFHPNGDIEVNDGGWSTMLTVVRMDKYTPERFHFRRIPYNGIVVMDGEDGEQHHIIDVDHLDSTADDGEGVVLRWKE